MGMNCGTAQCLSRKEHRFFFEVKFRMVMRIDLAVWHSACKEKGAWNLFEIIGEIFTVHQWRRFIQFLDAWNLLSDDGTVVVVPRR